MVRPRRLSRCTCTTNLLMSPRLETGALSFWIWLDCSSDVLTHQSGFKSLVSSAPYPSALTRANGPSRTFTRHTWTLSTSKRRISAVSTWTTVSSPLTNTSSRELFSWTTDSWQHTHILNTFLSAVSMRRTAFARWSPTRLPRLWSCRRGQPSTISSPTRSVRPSLL